MTTETNLQIKAITYGRKFQHEWTFSSKCFHNVDMFWYMDVQHTSECVFQCRVLQTKYYKRDQDVSKLL